MYECFHCGAKAVVWQADYDLEDFGEYERTGFVHICRCTNCGAEIEYRIYTDDEDEEENDDGEGSEE